MLKYFLILILSFLPSLFWLLIAEWLDRKRPEPKKAIRKAFLFGFLAACLAFIISAPFEYYLPKQKPQWLYITILSFFINGLVEEYSKYAMMSDKIIRFYSFDEPADGIIYGMTVGVGFAFFENFLFILSYGPGIIFIRLVISTLLHFLTGGLIGFWLGKARFYKLKPYAGNYGLFLAVIVHGLSNLIMRFGQGFWPIFPLAFILIFTYIKIFSGFRKMSD